MLWGVLGACLEGVFEGALGVFGRALGGCLGGWGLLSPPLDPKTEDAKP